MTSTLARHPLALALALGLFCIVSRLALLPWVPVPAPVIHDEFANLLGADTFAGGRLANPPHPLSDFFETFHVIQYPTYAEKYQPGQAIFLAAGQKLFGNPYFGVVLGVGVMIAAFYWMLLTWVPPAWALLGTAFAVLTFHVNHYWMESYWGAAIVAAGAALVIGAYPRLSSAPDRRASALAGAGAALLLLTRPYEGAGFLFLIAIAFRFRLRRAGLPFVAICCATLAFQSFYDWRVTGNPLLPPYVWHMRHFEIAPVLWILPPLPPKTYSAPEIAALHAGWEVRGWREVMDRPLPSRLYHNLYRIYSNLPDPFKGFWLVWILAVVLPDRSLRELAALALGAIGFLMLETWMMPHYEAPLVALGLTLMTRVAWRLWQVRPRRLPLGPVAVVLFAAIYALPAARATWRATQGHPPTPEATGTFTPDRAAVIAALNAAGGRNVVIVRYAPTHSPHREWVCNAADIDAAPIVWARDRGADNQRLLDYYRGRRFWLLEPDSRPYRLAPYNESTRDPLGRIPNP